MLRIENLRKVYGKLVAVNNLDLHLEQGDIMGFIGPNGAGKTTTIKMVATLLEPDAGTVLVNGIDVKAHPEEARPLMGYMPDFFGMYDDVMVWEYLDFFASAYRIPAKKRKGTIDDVLELTDLTIKRDALVSALSRGMQQRLCLAKTLLHDPKLLLLDEPSSGLDPRARIEIKELLKELQHMGKTILISSHILPELADFCNKIAIVEQGKLVVSGDVGSIMNQCQGGIVLKIGLVDRLEDCVQFLGTLENVSEARIKDGTIIANYLGEPGDQHSVLSALVKNDYKILFFNEAEMDLEDIFLKVTRGAVA